MMILPALSLLVAAQMAGPTVHTPAEWREDLAHVVSQVRQRHPAPYMFGASEEEFLAAADDLAERIPTLDDGRIVLEIFRVFGMLDDSHSEPFWNTIPADIIDLSVVPVRFQHMQGRLYVTQSMESHEGLLGSRLTAIEGRPADAVLKTAMAYMSGDNPIRRRTVAVEVVLTRPGILHALELCQTPGQVECTFETPDGEERTVSLTALDGPSFPPRLENEATVRQAPGTVWSERKWEHLSDQSSLPLWQQDKGRRYWFEYLPGERLLYMRFKRVIDDPAETFDAFTDRLFEFVDENDVDRLVIDMRKNRGGYGNFGVRFVERTSKHELGRQGNLFVIIGRGTKSAAPFFAQRLERAAQPIFVGESSGGRPTPFGNTFPIVFPNSGIAVRSGGAIFELDGDTDPRKTITPDIQAELTIEAFRANLDPALAAVIDYGRTAERKTGDD